MPFFIRAQVAPPLTLFATKISAADDMKRYRTGLCCSNRSCTWNYASYLQNGTLTYRFISLCNTISKTKQRALSVETSTILYIYSVHTLTPKDDGEN